MGQYVKDYTYMKTFLNDLVKTGDEIDRNTQKSVETNSSNWIVY